jgi:hypothetical protein
MSNKTREINPIDTIVTDFVTVYGSEATEADEMITKYIAVHGAISTEIVDSFIEFYNFLQSMWTMQGIEWNKK